MILYVQFCPNPSETYDPVLSFPYGLGRVNMK